MKQNFKLLLLNKAKQQQQQNFISSFLASCLPWIPEKGTVGASGDLAPMAHLALGMMGEGKMWSPSSGWGDARYVSISLCL